MKNNRILIKLLSDSSIVEVTTATSETRRTERGIAIGWDGISPGSLVLVHQANSSAQV